MEPTSPPPPPQLPAPPPPKSWSIYTRPEIIAKYRIHERVGSGAYSDVYKAHRLSDDLLVALKEVHDYQSAFREIEALRVLQNCPNVVVLHEYFWGEDEDAVLVLEFLRTDLAAVVRDGKKKGGIRGGEVKRWMMQILSGLDACHRNMVVHRDLKPGNLLISHDGILKLADFGQARILMEAGSIAVDEKNTPPPPPSGEQLYIHHGAPTTAVFNFERGNWGRKKHHRSSTLGEEEDSLAEMTSEYKSRDFLDEMEKETTNTRDGNVSGIATGTASEFGDDDFRSPYSYVVDDVDDYDDRPQEGCFTSCVGTRWFRAPELLYGSTDYGMEVDLWALGCIFAELLTLEPLFPGGSDIDQLGRIISVLGNLNEEVWPGCVNLPDYKTMSFGKVENPAGLESCLKNRSSEEVSLVRKLVCYDPSSRATAMELLHDVYFSMEPFPVPLWELHVPRSNSEHDVDSPGGWYDHKDGFDSDFDDFGPMHVTETGSGFSIRFP
ncbi:unnamed protein product [Linum tenue]|uniref:cyclin-dependent kinase n=1 Tax=Linum tenue TaxID=586396 RepID=A0AAV0S6M4_9ROSI|nr:unnamed protein product [Linum tenue]